MKAVLASAATALVLIGSGRAGSNLFWEPTQQTTQELAPSCGQVRALNIARIEWARNIHADYVANITDTSVIGSLRWHGYWVHVYDQTIALLKQDCYPPK